MNSYSTSWWSLLLIYRPREDERLSWPYRLTYSGRFTHINGYPSAAGPVQTSESSLVGKPTFYHWATQPTKWLSLRLLTMAVSMDATWDSRSLDLLPFAAQHFMWIASVEFLLEFYVVSDFSQMPSWGFYHVLKPPKATDHLSWECS